MIPQIGTDILIDGTYLVHVQDRDCLQQIAKVGVPDENGIVWDTQWIDWDRLTKTNLGECGIRLIRDLTGASRCLS